MEKKIHLVQLPEWPINGESDGPLLSFPEWPVEAGPLPRNLRNPHTAAYEVLKRLDAYGVSEWGFDSRQFINVVFFPLWDNDIDPDESVNEWLDSLRNGFHPSVLAAEIAAAMCAKAFRTYSRGETAAAWSYAIDAESWLGTLFAGTTAMLGREEARSNMAKKGADATHAENRSMKAEVFAWLVDNRAQFKSKEKAASAITSRQPITHRTAYNWVTEWEKLQSAGTL